LQVGTVDDAFSAGQNALEITRDNTDNITSIQFKTGASSERMRIDSSGNVGIGTTTPLSPLHIDATNGAENFIRLHDGNSSYGYAMGLGSNGDYIISKYDGGSAVEALRVKRTNGNIGINETSPINKLHIRNTTHSSTITGNATAGSIKFHSQSGSYTNGDYYGGIVWARPNSNGGTPTTFIASKITNNGSAADLVFGADTATVVTERMRIDNAGRVTMPYALAVSSYLNSSHSHTGTSNNKVNNWAAGTGTGHLFPSTRAHSSFNYTNSRFTAPVDGLYLMSYKPDYSTAVTTGHYVSFGINGGTRNFDIIEDIPINVNGGANYTAYLYLNQNDYVELYTHGGATYSLNSGGNQWNTWWFILQLS